MTASNFNENYMRSYAGHFESDGGAYDLVVPFEPHCIKLYNYTKYGTDGTNAECIWFKDFPAADALVKVVIENDGGSDRQSLDLLTSNGFTTNNTDGGVTDTHLAISGATQASPCVITTAAHGITVGERVRSRITKVLGMTELNDVSRNPYLAEALSSTTLALYDLNGNAIDSSGFTAYSSGGQFNNLNKTGDDKVLYDPPVYRLTLGTGVVGADGDEIYFEVFGYNKYEDLGDIDA